MTRLDAAEARQALTETLQQVAATGERIILSDAGQDLAVLISMRDLELLEELEDEREYEADLSAVREAQREGGSVPWEQVKTELGL